MSRKKGVTMATVSGQGGSDEIYTPRVLVDGIKRYVDPHACYYEADGKKCRVLCPFDDETSEFVKAFSDDPMYEVTYSHISKGDRVKDFFSYSLEELRKFSFIISNPPFSEKLKIFWRLHEANRPWAMVMTAFALCYNEVIDAFATIEPELLFFNYRVSYDGVKAPAWGSIYVCENVLPYGVVYGKLPHNNVRNKVNLVSR
jgi:hypothetical protein